MRLGNKKYKLSLLIKRWFNHRFSKYNPVCNNRCMISDECKNRWSIIKCGECWRADRYESL